MAPVAEAPDRPSTDAAVATAGGDGGGPGLGLSLVFGFFAIAGVFVAIAALVVAVSRDDGGPSGATASTPTVIPVSLSEFAIEGNLTAPPGPVTLEVTNSGSIVHNLSLEGGPTTPDLMVGETATLDLGELSAGSYTLVCLIAGHEGAGMTATLEIAEGAEVAGGAGAHAGHDEMDYAEMDRIMTESMLAFPTETEGSGNQLLEPRIAADGAKEYDVTASIIDWEVSEGKIVKAWAYNGMVPGPLLRVEVGDLVRFNLKNDLPSGTDAHFHGVLLPNNMDGVAPYTQPLIEPGQTFTYEFVAEAPAVGMYHAHHMGHEQVPNGLFGTILIGDVELPRGRTISGVQIPADLQVDHVVPMVLNDAGVIGLSLNGKSFPATEPYNWKVGSWVLVHYLNEGLQVHPMHLHQFPQLVVARDGIPLDNPYYADTLTVAPGERYSVLVNVNREGTWVWHCHILSHVEGPDGMFGMATAVIAEP